MSTTRARVTVTLDIDVPDTWGPDVTADQVQRQATESAMGALARGVTVGGRPGNDTDPKTRGWAALVGEPQVVAIVLPLAKRGS